MPTRITARIDPARSRIEARTSHDQPIFMDADPPEGDDSAPGPKETVLAALAGCTAIDVASILRKKLQRATAYEIVVTAESARDHPRVYTEITVEHRVGGVEEEALRRSIELSATRYCPVNAMVSRTATVQHRYRLTSADGTATEALVAVTGPDGSRVV